MIDGKAVKEVARKFSASLMAKGFTPQALHEYQDKVGNPLFWRIRLKHPETGEKWIRPLYFNSVMHQYLLSEPDFPDGKKPLYRLPLLLEPSLAHKTVWIVEGEYCADALNKLGLIATTSGSAKSALNADWRPLQERSIIIWPDNDESGTCYAEAVTEQLKIQNCSVQWVDVKQLNLPPKGDCVDWIASRPETIAHDIENLPLTSPAFTPTSSAKAENTPQAYFTVNAQGVFYHDEDNCRWICSSLEIKALVRDKSSENWGRLLEFYDADGLLHRWAMPMEMLKGNGEELRGELLRLGVEIASSHKARNLLTEYITTTKPNCRARCVTRTGWYEKVFVLPHATIGETTEEVFYQSEMNTGDYKQSGTLTGWQENVSRLCSGNSRLILAVSCAFAALLLKLVEAESGGIHFVGESSTGKTTALRVAASVFGAPDYLSRWRATTNGLEALASLRSDTLLILDELSQMDPKEAGEVAYMLANGMGKARASKQGHARSRQEWRLLFLSAGETGLAQHLSEAGKKIKAGQQVRFVDIVADAEQGHGIFENLHRQVSGAALSQILLENTQRYYGIASIDFLKQITLANWEQQQAVLKKACRKFLNENLPLNASGQVHRVCERFALIAAAGELATTYYITGWQEGEATQSAARCFHTWLEQRGTVCNQERLAVLSQVKSFFESHGEARFSDIDSIHPHTINRAGFRKTENNIHHYYVLPEVFRNEICAGFEYRQVCKFLMETGWIKADKDNTSYRREYLPGLGRSRCYVFTPRLWEE